MWWGQERCSLQLPPIARSPILSDLPPVLRDTCLAYYHPEESKKNKAFVVPVQSQLASVGVEGHVGQAGYYFMPDFEILRPALALR